MTQIEELLVEFQTNGISEVEIERVFELGFGSLRTAALIDDPETLALLRMVKTFPWLMQVADAPVHYEENETNRIMLHAAVDVIMNKKSNKK